MTLNNTPKEHNQFISFIFPNVQVFAEKEMLNHGRRKGEVTQVFLI